MFDRVLNTPQCSTKQLISAIPFQSFNGLSMFADILMCFGKVFQILEPRFLRLKALNYTFCALTIQFVKNLWCFFEIFL